MALTDKDLNAIKDLMKITIDEELEEKLNEKLKHFPSKEDFFSKMDEIMTELKTMREEQIVLTSKVYDDLEPRMEKVEKKVQIHPTA
ncbi:MAG: hypothetical protein UT24_C0009G0068 [Candidatus Woesebacteria bacterium GW2011_GWB1_39_12]|uniref:Uncharacterized protein n=2 Tax=Candidatus Woeseibacteriota TaxID=1752722 RepID=A0A0G0M2Y9_9BACT|nr:MAG: hypothetical protein UT23_C0002G0068 [Candidatus Woesebacteria bacterium GW2011_GWA1_39_12]KKR00751.1 MAG: hypothetical protein UT24_C0009G0068 [Candidatus Woesebacteria bacterium GW2011_GWB1_39_12]